MKRAIIYLRNQRLFVSSCAQTTSGLWIDDGPCVVVNELSATDQVGNAIQAAIERSSVGVAHPASWAAVQAPLLQAAGFKTWTTFGKKAKCVTVKFEGTYTFEPTVNQGSRGFIGAKDKAIQLPPSATYRELGEAVLAALAVSA